MIDSAYPLLAPHELAQTGQALFGAGWRAALAHAIGVKEAEIVSVESGNAAAPSEWRAQLIALAQDMALRSLEVANNLLWRDLPEEAPQELYAPQAPRYA
ncbi:hypothetical protein [Candidatus Viadribacter manganicus]|uniref:Uncharacterized protein n=1 Tax=Candidatus Viadribacter manganicus TaxID=1759059 RepID=A0A1B1AIH9_9PROT|nr:hypothetical protein [Candidatus Viadribacter manganicus]ANP46363.1 hypothetical protein ATE48_10775 [Candidatus Viadribacter manganicus]